MSNNKANGTKNNFSPLLDPIILESKAIKKPDHIKLGLNKYLDRLSTINYFNLFINWIIPIVACIFFSFQLKAKYEQKQDLAAEYAAFEYLQDDDI